MAAGEPAPSGLAAGEPARVVELRRRVMGSELQLVVVDPSAGQLAWAVAHLEALERRWSRFLDDSDLSRLNRAGGAPVAVDEATLTLVATMVEAWRDTAGAYDPTILPALVAAGGVASRHDDARRTVLPPGAVFGAAAPSAIVLDGREHTITMPVGMAIDAGGIGKGLAADLVVAELLAGGAAGALCSIGGDLSMAGRPPAPDGWFVAVEQPDPQHGIAVTLAVSGGGVATSSVRSRRWRADGRGRSAGDADDAGDAGQRHHVIDPRTGRPAHTDLVAVTVIARSGWLAEAHATAALLRGSDGVLDHLEGHGLSGLAVDTSGRWWHTADLAGITIAGAEIVELPSRPLTATVGGPSW